MGKNKTLLKKYDIPINHLDFGYIDECQNARELEKIVQVLRSGEEGYFPDLTKYAEKKLKQLNPNSKLFRYEEQIKLSDCLDVNELKPIYDWNKIIKAKDTELVQLKHFEHVCTVDLPPLRKTGKIHAQKADTAKAMNATKITKKMCEKKRIISTDYKQWDKYDPDVEILRMDLEEERVKEEVERKYRLNGTENMENKPKIVEISEPLEQINILANKLSLLEREKLAEDHRLYGNEYFRAKEYDNALKEYTIAINYDNKNAARSLNNRAITYIKLKQYLPAIEDCLKCLQLEPGNLKARLRLAEAYYSYGCRHESYDMFLKVLEIDSTNTDALKAIQKLKAQFGEMPPATATRILIKEEAKSTDYEKISAKKEYQKQSSDSVISSNESNSCCQLSIKNQHTLLPKEEIDTQKLSLSNLNTKEYDLAELIKPNRIVKSKLSNAAEVLGNIKSHEIK